ncbi:hypothetical protein H8356DRAFT_1327063 [Neocallimastix lanati (nom. inval.)]|nr:hypothetical protein H8356DRAFT_1327063 [Neocallimastix sp. JGI-2020a]
MKKKKKDQEIEKIQFLFNVNIKHTNNEISQGMGLIYVEEKLLSPDIETFNKILNESKYYINYQVFIIKTYVTELNYSSKYNSIEITPKIFYCHFEKAISSAAEKVFLNDVNIKYCICYETENWNYYDNIEHITNNEDESKYYID